MALADDYRSHLLDVIAKVKALQRSELLNFIFFTDPHHRSGGNQLRAAAAIKQLAAATPLDFIICGGDMSINGEKPEVLMSQREMIQALTVNDCVLLPVKGNHDDNSIHDFHNPSGVVANVVFPEETYGLAFKRLEGTVAFDDHNPLGMYYFYDVPEKKTRVIVLNCIDIPYKVTGNGKLQYNGQWQYAFSDAQLHWMAHTALNLSDKCDRDWRVIVFSHVAILQQGVYGTDQSISNDETMWGILKAFKTGSAYRSDYMAGDFGRFIDVDFSGRDPGQLIACFFGHVHYDQSLEKEGITMVSSLNAMTYQEFEDSPAREVGTITETAFDVVTVDFAKNAIYCTRFGAGKDRTIPFN